MGDKKIVLCREVDKNSGNIAVYPVDAKVTDGLLLKLSIRSRLNPELKYYAILAETWDSHTNEILKLLKRRNVSKKAVKHYADIVKI